MVLKRLAATRGIAPALLVPAAAFAVHQLRYLLAFGGRAGIVLQRQGHSYLHSLAPWIALLVAVEVGLFLRRLGSAFRGQWSGARFAGSFAVLWLICATSLVAIYTCQELLEGLFATGHPTGLIGVFGYGGWWSVPAALCLGLVLAALFYGARWALDEVARRHTCQPQRSVGRKPPQRRPDEVFIARLSPLAGGWSGRGPPV